MNSQKALEIAENVFAEYISRRVVGGDYEEQALEVIRAALKAADHIPDATKMVDVESSI